MNDAEKQVSPIKRLPSVKSFQAMLSVCHVIQSDVNSRGFTGFTLQMVFMVIVVGSFGSVGCSTHAAMKRLYSGTGSGYTLRNVRASLLALIKRGYVVRVGLSTSPRYVLSVYARELLRPYL